MATHVSLGQRQSFLQDLARLVAKELEGFKPERNLAIVRRQLAADFFPTPKREPHSFRCTVAFTGWPTNVRLEGNFREHELRASFTGTIPIAVRGDDVFVATFFGQAGVDSRTEELILLEFEHDHEPT